MSEWKTYKLGELVEINKNSINKNYSFEEIEYLDTSSVTENRFSELQKLKLSEAPSRAKRVVKENDIVYSTVRPILRHYGIAKNIKPNTIASTGFAVLSPKKIDADFLFYYLTTDEIVYFLNSVAEANTTTFPAFNASLFENIEVTIPESIETQTQIAQILTSLDDKIELNLQMNQTLEAMAQALFKEWFVNFNFPKSSEPLIEPDLVDDNDFYTENEKSTKSFNQKNHGSDKLPKGWRMGKLGEEFNLTMGQSPKGETLNQENEGMIFYQGRTDFGFRFPTNRVFTTEPNRIANKLDTLVCVRAPVGDVNMAIEKCCIGRGLSAVIHKSKGYSYTYYSMKNMEPIFKGFESEGTVFGSLNKNNFENIEIIIPSQYLIKEFEKVANSIDEKILNNTLEIKTLTQTRDTLLPKLMSGKISLNCD